MQPNMRRGIKAAAAAIGASGVIYPYEYLARVESATDSERQGMIRLALTQVLMHVLVIGVLRLRKSAVLAMHTPVCCRVWKELLHGNITLVCPVGIRRRAAHGPLQTVNAWCLTIELGA